MFWPDLHPPWLTPFNTNLHMAPVELHTTTKLPLVGKEYLCLQTNSKFIHAAQCVKLRMLNNSIDSILYNDTF